MTRGSGSATRFALGALLLALAFAGCGGGGDDRPEKPAVDARQAELRWLERVDEECEKANDAIARHGWPADLVDLDRLVVRAIDDVRSATAAIAELHIPAGSGPVPARFVRELQALDAELEQLSAASEDLEPAMLTGAADALKLRLSRIEKLSGDLGLRRCVTHDERQFVPDAIRGPVFAERLAQLDRRLLRRFKGLNFAKPDTPDELAAMFRRYSQLIESALAGMEKLEPPLWAERQTAAYEDSLLDLQGATQKFETALEVEDRAATVRADRAFRKAVRAEAKARRRMIRALGSAPTTRDGPEQEVDPETEEIA
jgi:hypothetical protein